MAATWRACGCTCAWIKPCRVGRSVAGTTPATKSLADQSRMLPTTGVLPTAPRPARSFFFACLFRSLPPI